MLLSLLIIIWTSSFVLVIFWGRTFLQQEYWNSHLKSSEIVPKQFPENYNSIYYCLAVLFLFSVFVAITLIAIRLRPIMRELFEITEMGSSDISSVSVCLGLIFMPSIIWALFK